MFTKQDVLKLEELLQQFVPLATDVYRFLCNVDSSRYQVFDVDLITVESGEVCVYGSSGAMGHYYPEEDWFPVAWLFIGKGELEAKLLEEKRQREIQKTRLKNLEKANNVRKEKALLKKLLAKYNS